jgi:hypothetical protein
VKLFRFAIAFVLLGLSSRAHAQGWIGRLAVAPGGDVDLSMVLRRDYQSSGKFTPFLIGGPNLTIHPACNTQVLAAKVDEFDCERTSFASRLEFTLVAGYGLSRMIGSTTVSVEARASADVRERALGWSIMVGASMPLRRALADSVTCNGRAPCQRRQ